MSSDHLINQDRREIGTKNTFRTMVTESRFYIFIEIYTSAVFFRSTRQGASTPATECLPITRSTCSSLRPSARSTCGAGTTQHSVSVWHLLGRLHGINGNCVYSSSGATVLAALMVPVYRFEARVCKRLVKFQLIATVAAALYCQPNTFARSPLFCVPRFHAPPSCG